MEGLGVTSGLTLRAAIPLRYVQLDAGAGLQTPLTLQGYFDPASALHPHKGTPPEDAGKGNIAAEFGFASRIVAGMNAYVLPTWRIFTEYHFDYRFANIHPGHPVDNESFLRHSIIAGVWYSPKDYREARRIDRAVLWVPPVVATSALSIIALILKSVLGSSP
jgi:hypothetical protein